MSLFIDKCIEEFDKLSSAYGEIVADDNTQSREALMNRAVGDFQYTFFVEMNNALFRGEYLYDNYIRKIGEFESKVVHYDEVVLFGSVRHALQCLRDLVLEIRGIVDRKHFYLAPSYSTKKRLGNTLIDFWTEVSLPLAYIDHTLICDAQHRDDLVRLIIQIMEKINGITESNLSDKTFERLLIKATFLLKKIWIYDNDVELSISIASKIYEVKDVVKAWSPKIGDYFTLFTKMYSKPLTDALLLKYEDLFESKNYYSLQCFVVLAYNYATINRENKNTIKHNLKKLRVLRDRFQAYKFPTDCNQFDRYAFRTVDCFIQNCYFSLFTKSQECTIDKLRDELENVKELERRTGIRNYHPYKKALNFLKSSFQEYEKIGNEISKESLELYNYIYKKYEENYKACIREHLYTFQLTVNECIASTDDYGDIFVASLLALPIIPEKLEEARLEFREVKLYGRVSVDIRERQQELEKLVNETNDNLIGYRKEIFEYLGVFIALATILFGSIQYFLKENTTITSIQNFLSIAILLALFMLLLDFVASKKRPLYLFIMLTLFILLLILLPHFLT